MKVAFIDLDGVVVDASLRFLQAKNTASLTFSEEFESKQWTSLYWKSVFDPQAIMLDELIAGSCEALDQLERDGYQVVFLTSRPEGLRQATIEWLQVNGLSHDVYKEDTRLLVCKPAAFQFTKTIVWKAGTVHQLASMWGATEVLVIDDESVNVSEIQKFAGAYSLSCFPTLQREVAPALPDDDEHPF